MAWGLGRYERIAGELIPVAETAVDPLSLESGESLAFEGDSVWSYLDADFSSSPRWVEARSVLAPAGRWNELRDGGRACLHIVANDDPPIRHESLRHGDGATQVIDSPGVTSP
jgi:hypothetical protein